MSIEYILQFALLIFTTEEYFSKKTSLMSEMTSIGPNIRN